MGKYVCRVKTVSRGGENTMTVQAIITSFYDGLTQKNNEWQKNVSESIVFSDASQKLHAEGKEAFIQSFTTFLRAVEKVHMKQLIVEETNACAVVSYDYVSPKGGKLHQDDAEVWKVVDGKIVALTIYFDITEFRSFMGR
jgi:ketosteroid isomerase-like protein